MAIELKEIINVETATIKDVREAIAGLREEVSRLKLEGKDYRTEAEKINVLQRHMSEVMNSSKKYTADAAESFNAMTARLRQLKDQWKATGDEARRAQLGKEINALKERINDANESIGNFQHNVGNYTNSIVDAFGKMGVSVGQPITKMTSLFGFLQGGIDKAFEAVQKLWAAIAANPMGALIAVLGTLIVFWDDLKEAIGAVKTPYQDIIDKTEEFTQANKDAQIEMNRTLKLMAAMGASELEIAAARTRELHGQLDKVNQKITDQETELADLESWWKRIGRAVFSVLQYILPVSDAMRDMFGMGGKTDGLRESIAKLKEEQKDLNDAFKDAAVEEFVAQTKEDEKATKKATAARKEDTEAVKLQAEALRELQGEVDKMVAQAQTAQEEYDKGLEKATAMYDELQRGQLSDLELEELRYKERLKLFEQYGLDTELLEEEHQERMAEIRKRESQQIYAELEAQRKAQEAQDEKAKKSHEKLMKARETATKNMASGTSSILKNLSVAMGENTKLGKGFAIAAATIDTIASAVAGFRAGMNQWAEAGPMAWMAPVQAAINATMALTAGFAEVQKIRSVDTSGNSDGGGGGATALAIPNIEGLSTPMDYTRQVVTDTEQEELNRNNRVYILESDIQESGNRVRVREEETTF